MKKIFAAVVFICILFGAANLFIPRNADESYYKALVNHAFKASLDENNSTLMYKNAILSRDSIYVLHFRLAAEHINQLLNNGVHWSNEPADLIRQYVAPYEKHTEGLAAILQAADTTSCYAAVHVQAITPYNADFSFALISIEQQMLYFFHFTS